MNTRRILAASVAPLALTIALAAPAAAQDSDAAEAARNDQPPVIIVTA
ncbi:hypothetical protein [Alteraurantiacibacter buctensis]|uniref:Uncharacterized protein n=1 Tax=Alteraurantiacibacter buctensis TaxID=1503981 RepID=A0A844YX75_9SPHN|nr:hypothetical protein [Alteraurantiacibacter buctensis]MXO71570.1 hypothetical protein [Alteraurantiacibacter buctensis]